MNPMDASLARGKRGGITETITVMNEEEECR
jgi:hypothetical protein